MGKIKSKAVKKTARILLNEDIDFSKDFDKNKKILKSINPSKKVTNQLAGYITRLVKFQKQKINQN